MSNENTALEPKNAECNIYVSDDQLKAYITVLPPENGGEDITEQAIKEAMAQHKVVYGINGLIVPLIAREKRYNERFELASGKKETPGVNGRLEPHFIFGKRGEPKINIDGSVDFKELNLIYNVEKGDVLCDIIPPTDGESGMTVTGLEIAPMPGRPANLPLSRNVILSADETHIIADVAGNLVERGSVLEIDEVFTVHADVDNSTGNLDFVGSIVVKGDVKGGFKLKARGNIEVRGMVENSYLSAGGDVTLNGMNGRDEGSVEAGGNIKAAFVENAVLTAKKDIQADSMMYCKITCGGDLTLSGKRGCLIGGTAIVVKNVTAKAIGTITHTATELVLGTASLLIGERERLTAQIKECDDDILKLIQVVSYLKSKPIETLSPDRVKMLQQASFNIQIYNNKKVELQARVAEIESELKKPNLSTVTCKGTIFTGTKVTMNNASVRITEDRDATLLYLDGSEIAFGLA